MTQADTTIPVVPSTPLKIRPRRHLRPWLQRPAGKLMVGTLMALALCLASWAILPRVEQFWIWATRQLLVGLSVQGGVSLSSPASPVPAWSHLTGLSMGIPEATPDNITWFWHVLGTLGIAVLALGLRAPLRTPVLLTAVFHAGLCSICMLMDGGQTYGISEHTQYLTYCTETLILLLPVMLAGAHYIIENSLERRVLATILIAGYLIVAHPFRLVLHALIIQTATGLAEPTLFLLGGPALDMFLITALYTWVTAWRHHPD